MATARYALNKNKYLLDPEREHLEITLFNSEHPNDLRDTLILTLALKTGARASELLLLKKSDLNLYDESVFLKGLKGSNDRELPLNPDLFKRLHDYAQTITTERIFPFGYHRLRQIWDWYRPVPKKFHCLRHTFAIQLYKKTRDLRLVQVALGHRNITNTMIYADYIYSQQELKKLIL
jgi:integrase